MSVYDGTEIEKENYKYRKEIEEGLLKMYGPFNKEHNVGKFVDPKLAKSFLSTSYGLYMGGFLRNHPWNVSMNYITSEIKRIQF